MTIFLQKSENDFLLKIQRIACLESAIVSIERVSGGGNSRVFKIQCESGNYYCVKFYFPSLHDQRDRLGTEYGSLKFIYEQGIQDIPKPIFMDRSELMGVYEWVDGHQITAQEITAKDIGFAVNFLAQLKNLSQHPDARKFNLASEACFDVKDIVDQMEIKLKRFQSCLTEAEELRCLRIFLDQDFTPILNEILLWVKSNLGHISFDQDIGEDFRTLSPSDFGFHNALRVRDGQIKFLDFEYFGWDDPAKTIIDFTLHPAMNLSVELKQDFYKYMLSVFKDDKALRNRVACYYPLLGLKWCLILLNEFIKDDLKRRQFAMLDTKGLAAVQQRQLKKAEDLLLHIRKSYKRFPYEC